MNSCQYRILIIASHPVQYGGPLYRLMAQDPRLEIQVSYCSMHGVETSFDPGFGTDVAWDIPLLDGYSWVQVNNNSPKPQLGNFWGLINLGLWQQIVKNNFDAVIIYTGYTYASFWIAAIATKWVGSKLLFSSDASEIEPRNRQKWKTLLKSLVIPRIYQLADIVMVVSTLGKQMVQNLGIPERQIALTPFTVDNNRWLSDASQVDICTVRQQWNIPETANVLLFCAKLQDWKRPQDVLKAFAKANVEDSYLVFVGEGPLKSALIAEVESLGLIDRVKFLGFVNQSQLASIYRSANLFILASDYEPFGLVVNEAMLCGCPVIVSDRVGSRADLVKKGETGFIYPCGNIAALTTILQNVLGDREQLQTMGIAATKLMESWSPYQYTEAIVNALENSKSNI
jgi:glycosyltransferase involved in cell wall biosynthesis